MVCEKCGTRLKDDAKFCSKCGSRIAETVTPSSSVSASVVPSLVPKPAGGKKKIGRAVVIAGIAMVLIAFSVIFVVVGGANRVNVLWQLNVGNRYLDDMKYEEAIVAFEAVIAIDPKVEEAYVGLADAYVGLGDYESALAVLNQGIEQVGSELLGDYWKEVQENYAEVEERVPGLDQEDKRSEGFGSRGDFDEDQNIGEKYNVFIEAGNYEFRKTTEYSLYLVATEDSVISFYDDHDGDTDVIRYKTEVAEDERIYCSGESFYITVHSGRFAIEDAQGHDLQSLDIYEKLDHEVVFGIELNAGDTLTVDNQFYNGRITDGSVVCWGNADDNLAGTRTRTDYWWNKYMQFDISENVYDISPGGEWWEVLQSSNKVEYRIEAGSMKWYIRYSDVENLVIN